MPHKTTEQMNEELSLAWMFFTSKGKEWKHYKGGIYRVLTEMKHPFGFNTDTGELMVSYMRIDGPDFQYFKEGEVVYSRPFREWKDQVEVDGKKVPRFVAVRKAEIWVEK